MKDRKRKEEVTEERPVTTRSPLEADEVRAARALLDASRWDQLAPVAEHRQGIGMVHLANLIKKRAPDFSVGFFVAEDMPEAKSKGWEPITKAHLKEIDPDGQLTETVLARLALHFDVFGHLVYRDLTVCIQPTKRAEALARAESEAAIRRYTAGVRSKKEKIAKMHEKTEPEDSFTMGTTEISDLD